MTDRQQNRLTDLIEDVEDLDAELAARDDKDQADREQLQALRRAKSDLKRAGAHMGRAGAKRHMDRAESRIEGIQATADL